MEIFGLHKINKNIIYYAFGASLCGVGFGIALQILANVGLLVSISFFVIGFFIAQLYYNKILR